MPVFTDTLAQLGDLSVAFAPAPAGSLPDAELLQAQRSLAEVQRRVQSQAAVVAAEIAHRSRRELGHAGLAATHGRRSAEELISTLAGTSTRDARTLVKAGELLPVEVTGTQDRASVDAAAAARWSALIGAAVARATLSVEAAGVIRSRLTEAAKRLDAAEHDAAPDATGHTLSPLDDVAREQLAVALAAAAERLIATASGLTIEQLAVRASRERDELDLAGIAAREEAMRERRFLRVHRQLDGMTRVTGLLDPESAAIIVPILDAATSPRRGGPRFVDPDAASRAEDIVRDSRSTEQLTLDTLVELVRTGARVDDGTLLGDKTPAVRILVTQNDLEAAPDTTGSRAGAAYFEGQTEPASIDTAERYICTSGAIPILFDGDGRVLNLGRTQRLFSDKQRLAMAARDGGCLMCDRPPSWCEAHHINHWDQHHGRTDIDDGVLLCRHCHLMLHNRNWRIRRHGGNYFLDHPDTDPDDHGAADRDPRTDGTLRSTPLASRSPAAHRLLTPA